MKKEPAPSKPVTLLTVDRRRQAAWAEVQRVKTDDDLERAVALANLWPEEMPQA